MPKADTDFELVDAIAKEYELRRTEVPHPISTVYIGGGTPSILSAQHLTTLVRSIPLAAEIEEFTIEANPEDITVDKVKLWLDLGINRVSMGVQSLVDDELRIIGRRHNAASALNAVDILRTSGIDNISLDLIYGLPNQTLESWRYSLETLLRLKPEHFSAYLLSYEPRTRLTALRNKGVIQEADEDNVIAMYDMLCDTAREYGYDHYEISNFCLPGREAKHNSSYWDYTPYLGLGPSAHSFDGKIRRINPSNLKQYLEAIGTGLTAYEIDAEDKASMFNDLLITALRTKKGLELSRVPRRRRRRLLCDVFPHLQNGTVQLSNDTFTIPERQWLISDAILTDLIQID